MANKVQSCKLYDANTKLVATVDVPLHDPQAFNTAQQLPECFTHQDKHYQKVGQDKYAETPRDVRLDYADGKSEVVQLFHPLPHAVVKGGKSFHRMNEDFYKEAVVLNLDAM